MKEKNTLLEPSLHVFFFSLFTECCVKKAFHCTNIISREEYVKCIYTSVDLCSCVSQQVFFSLPSFVNPSVNLSVHSFILYLNMSFRLNRLFVLAIPVSLCLWFYAQLPPRRYLCVCLYLCLSGSMNGCLVCWSAHVCCYFCICPCSYLCWYICFSRSVSLFI